MNVHPRLSISALSSWSWTFEQDLELWRSLDGLHHVGLLASKLEPCGHERAVEALRDAGLKVSCLVAGSFDLRSPDTWAATRTALARCIDTAVALDAPCIYVTTGRTTHAPWREMLETFAGAIEPTIAYGAERGVRVALEPSQRIEVSFVHSLRDALVVADRTGIGIVADIGNSWMERDVEAALTEIGEHMALIQVADVQVGTMEQPGLGGKGVPGDGDLPVERWLGAALATGYAGQIELEMVGPMVESVGYESAITRAIESTTAMLDRLVP
ncbi:MAG: sugar phosphate isomerase/epimerase family protein [Acidimicrobiia bacterium]